jgi:hypothetical protein
VSGEGEDDHRQRGQHQDVDRPIDGYGSQDVAISERSATQWKLELVPVWWMITGRLRWRGKWKPGIASQTSVPPKAGTFSSEQSILLAQLARIGAD